MQGMEMKRKGPILRYSVIMVPVGLGIGITLGYALGALIPGMLIGGVIGLAVGLLLDSYRKKKEQEERMYVRPSKSTGRRNQSTALEDYQWKKNQ